DLHRRAEEERPRDPPDGQLAGRQSAAQRLGVADRGDPAGVRGTDAAAAANAAAGPAGHSGAAAAGHSRPAAAIGIAMMRRGFTLLEVMIAVAVLALIGALTWQ